MVMEGVYCLQCWVRSSWHILYLCLYMHAFNGHMRVMGSECFLIFI